MTLATGQKKQYDGNDVATDFPFPYYFEADADLVVVHRTTAGVETYPVLDVDYEVTGEGGLSGNVEFPIGGSAYDTLATGERIAILREKDLAENLTLSGKYQWVPLNNRNDTSMMINQQLQEQIDRSLKQPVTDSDSLDMTLPNSIDRADKNLGFDENGEPIATITITNTITSGDGAPTSAPSSLGDTYIDTTNDITYTATGTTSSADWKIITLVSSGAGAPSTTPQQVGEIYIDETNKHAYIAIGTSSSADWKVTTRTIRYPDFSLVKFDSSVAEGDNLYGDFVMPFDGTFLQSDTNKQWLMANNTTAGDTGTMIIDIKLNGTTIMDTNKLDIETGDKTTEDATTQPDLTTTTFSRGDILTWHVVAIHSGTAAEGLAGKIALLED